MSDQLSCNLREQVVCVLFFGERLAEQLRDIRSSDAACEGACRLVARDLVVLDFLSRCHDAQIRIRQVAVARCTECDSRNTSIATRTDYVLYVRCADYGSVWSIPSLQPPDAQTPCSSVLPAFQSGATRSRDDHLGEGGSGSGADAWSATYIHLPPTFFATAVTRTVMVCGAPPAVGCIVTVAVPWPRDRSPEVV